MRILIFLAGLLGLTVAAGADVGGTFELRRETERDWQATYCFDEPVEHLSFSRPIPGMRSRSWRAGGQGFYIDYQGDVAQLARADGTPFSCGTVRITTDTMIPSKDYMPFSTFSDGGVSVYTGYMTGLVFVRGDWRTYDLKATYTGLEGDQVITRNPDILGHQFVYFGHQPVKVLPEATLIIDPAIPASARLGVLTTLPLANKLLADLFGYTPKEPYMVFMAAGELESDDGDHTKGGVHPYQIQFTIKGRGAVRWSVGDPFYFPQFTIHEVLHLWQADAWHQQLGQDWMWVHEGGADALSYELMRLSGGYDAAKYRHMWLRAEKRCMEYLKETSVHGAEKSGRFDAIYQCGALVNRLVGEALNPEEPGDGIIRFWQMMTTWDEETIRLIPSERLYFDTMRRLSFSELGVVALEAFLTTTTADPAATVQSLRRRLTLPR